MKQRINPMYPPPSHRNTVTEATTVFQERLRTLNAITIELTKCATLDQLSHDAIEAGIRRLGFDRMGIGFFDETEAFFEGSFGTDEQGNVRDERNLRIPIDTVDLMMTALKNNSTLEYAEDTPLYNNYRQEIAHGWNALALLWDGDRALGWISVDNLLNQRPLTPADFDILNLYGTSLGHLCRLKRTEQALVKEHNLLRTLIDTVHDYVFVKDNQSRFTLVNMASWKLGKRGRSEADMIGKTDFDFFPQELAQQYYEQEQQIMQTGEAITDLLEPNVTADGNPVIMLTSKIPLKDEQGQVIGLVGISRDVTNYVRSERQVQANEARFKLMAEMAAMSNVGVVMGNNISSITHANDAFLRITGYERDDLPHMNLIAMTPPEYIANSANTADEKAASKVVSVEKELICKDGSRVPVLQVGNLVNDTVQDFIYFVIDLRPQRQIEAERLEAALHKERAQLLTEFVTNLSHDLKTPLAIIQNSIYLIERLDDPVLRKAKTQNIRDQIVLLDKLIQSVLSMSRLDSGYQLTFNPIDLNRVMTELENALRPAAERKSQTLTLDLQPDLPLVKASESELCRAIVNLIENALNYTPESGTIRLRTHQKQGRVIVEVQDTGMGIEPDMLPHIFDRFIRAEPTRSTVSGTGLGLSIVKRIMELHGGTVEVESTVGEGSTFRIQLPLVTS